MGDAEMKLTFGQVFKLWLLFHLLDAVANALLFAGCLNYGVFCKPS